MPVEPIRLLLVEDNEDDAALLTRLLLTAGYALTHECVETEAAFRAALDRESWDVILADYSMPAFDATRALEILHELNLDIPFLVVTGTITDLEAVRLMEAGVPDYIIKGRYERLPFVIARETRNRMMREKARLTEADLRATLASLRTANNVLTAAPDETAQAFARALELCDKEIEGHSQRIMTMTVRLARELDVQNGALVHIRRGALLHDVGKMGIPNHILNKPGPLTETEWTIMRRHPIIAYEILSPLAYFDEAVSGPYYHHERYDGSGYPRGLIGEAIPLPARILAVVDAYDALISPRPYKVAWARPAALAEIQRCAGTHFDPDVARMFLRTMESGALW